MGSGAKLKEVRAVYDRGTLRLLDELKLADGVQVRLLVETIHPGDTDQAAEKKDSLSPTRR